jgi:hypothetical protein
MVRPEPSNEAARRAEFDATGKIVVRGFLYSRDACCRRMKDANFALHRLREKDLERWLREELESLRFLRVVCLMAIGSW